MICTACGTFYFNTHNCSGGTCSWCGKKDAKNKVGRKLYHEQCLEAKTMTESLTKSKPRKVS